MREFFIRLSSMDDIAQLVSIATVQDCRVELRSGDRTTSAKSLMGLFNFDMDAPIHVKVDGQEESVTAFCDAVAAFVVEP